MNESDELIRLDKKRKALSAAKFLSKRVPLVQAVLLTGSVASGRISEDDDLDFLIITKRNRVFTTRFCCYFWALILAKKRTKNNEKDKWCMNIFLDEDYLLIPEKKRNKFAASQLTKIIVLCDKSKIADSLYQNNAWWIKEYINTNGKKLDKSKTNKIRLKNENNFFWLEELLRWSQELYMCKKITNEYISRKQIFFHPINREERV